MDIELPPDEQSSDNDSVFSERIDLYEAYWLYVDGVRYVGPVLEQSSATETDDDRSPLARHYNHFYDNKESHKEKCRDLVGTLPAYKDRFEEPRGDVVNVPRSKLNDLGIEWEDGDDPIWLPSEYELPPVWETDAENMNRDEVDELVETLRAENEALRAERDTLEEQLTEVRRALSAYLASEQGREPDSSLDASSLTCGDCGAIFETEAGKHGHKPHCDGDNSAVDLNDLAQLAEELPALSDDQSVTNQDRATAEEELRSLNHLLQGNL